MYPRASYRLGFTCMYVGCAASRPVSAAANVASIARCNLSGCGERSNSFDKRINFRLDGWAIFEAVDEPRRQASQAALGPEKGADDAAGVDILTAAVGVTEHALFKLRVGSTRQPEG